MGLNLNLKFFESEIWKPKYIEFAVTVHYETSL